jgi:DNA-binding CsgD family transcriptional regulator
VSRKRRLLGIPSYHPPPHDALTVEWTAEGEALLGKMSDQRAAEALGVSRVAVAAHRRELGIAAFGRQPVKIRWTRKQLGALGGRSDRELAERLGVSKASVTKKRLELGIPAFSESRRVVITRELRRLLGLPPSVARRKTGLKFDTIRKLRDRLGIAAPRLIDVPWTKAALAKLGKLPDARLAADLGVDLSAVRGRRIQRGIPPFRAWRRWTEREVALLRSSLSDEEIARRVKRKPHSVRAKRRSLQKR